LVGMIMHLRKATPPRSSPELCLNLGDGVNQAADLISATSSAPSSNFTRLMTFGNWFWPLAFKPPPKRRWQERTTTESAQPAPSGLVPRLIGDRKRARLQTPRFRFRCAQFLHAMP
jgi:hypothetical protein